MFNRKNTIRWKTPGGGIWPLYQNMADQPHLLVAGATGSGKSVLLNGIIATLIHDAPSANKLILIDPKRTELFPYRNIPHTIAYAYEDDTIINALKYATHIMDTRLEQMRIAQTRTFHGAHIYVVSDELADLLLRLKKQAKPLLQRLLQLGRCCSIHCLCASQCVNATVISTELKVNMSAIVGLRTATKAHSRLIVDIPGCELFPDPQYEHKAYGYYRHGANCELWELPYVKDSEINGLCRYWTSRECRA